MSSFDLTVVGNVLPRIYVCQSQALQLKINLSNLKMQLEKLIEIAMHCSLNDSYQSVELGTIFFRK